MIAHLSGEGLASVLPWGSAGEHARAVALAEGLRDAVVAPRLGLRTLAGVVGKAAFWGRLLGTLAKAMIGGLIVALVIAALFVQ